MMKIAERSMSPVCGECCTRIEHLGVSFGNRRILEGIDLHIHCGQLAVIIGPNGAGKTTFLRAILGEIPHTGLIRNAPSVKKGRRRFRLGYVPQRLEFDATSPVTVMDLFAASLSAWPVWLGFRGAVKKAAVDALRRVDIDRCAESRIGALSGGQLQRVLLALALTPVPDLLLLDEPVSGVDPSGIELFYRMISELRRTHHLAILLVSHDCAVAARYADRLLFLNHTVMADGKPRDVLRSRAVTDTFGTIPLPDERDMNDSTLPCGFSGGSR
jgi:zinc transport system ATP-binding protein